MIRTFFLFSVISFSCCGFAEQGNCFCFAYSDHGLVLSQEFQSDLSRGLLERRFKSSLEDAGVEHGFVRCAAQTGLEARSRFKEMMKAEGALVKDYYYDQN